jgi:hypothetical protein
MFVPSLSWQKWSFLNLNGSKMPFLAGAHGIADRRCGNALDGHRRRALIRPLVSDCDAECDKVAPDLTPCI